MVALPVRGLEQAGGKKRFLHGEGRAQIAGGLTTSHAG